MIQYLQNRPDDRPNPAAFVVHSLDSVLPSGRPRDLPLRVGFGKLPATASIGAAAGRMTRLTQRLPSSVLWIEISL